MENLRPGGKISSRPLNFIWIVDSSNSMRYDGKMNALNNAIRDAIPLMLETADENPNAQLFLSAVKFGSGASWHINQVPIEEFVWEDIEASGVTDLGRALTLVSESLTIPPMSSRALPPVLVLISDGHPTDNYKAGLQKIMQQPWGRKSVRIAISIGIDADDEILKEFIGNDKMEPLKANNPDVLVSYIKWVSTSVVKSTSSPSSRISNEGNIVEVIDIPIPANDSNDDIQVW